jgi:hypothetical protein
MVDQQYMVDHEQQCNNENHCIRFHSVDRMQGTATEASGEHHSCYHSRAKDVCSQLH